MPADPILSACEGGGHPPPFTGEANADAEGAAILPRLRGRGTTEGGGGGSRVDHHILILGGQRSGKSRFAESLVAESGRRPVYVATAAAGDAEMAERIAAHRARRGGEWTTIEEPLDLAATLGRVSEGSAILVDCLTLWLSNLMEAGRDISVETGRLLEVLAGLAAPAVLVSNEVGAGIIPANALARRFADAQGILNQRVANAVGRVVFMAAGRPLLLKPSTDPEIRL